MISKKSLGQRDAREARFDLGSGVARDQDNRRARLRIVAVQRDQRDVLQRVQAYASAKKFDLVVADAIYFSSAVDITADILAELQKTDSQKSSSDGGGQ